MSAALKTDAPSWVRASSADRVIACPSSALPAEHHFNPSSGASQLGDATHEALAAMVSGLEPDLERIATAYGVSTDDVAPLYYLGRRMWRALPAWLGERGINVDIAEAKAEVRVEAELTGGTLDVLIDDGRTRVIIDWKTGRLDTPHYGQLAAYAYASCESRGMPASGEVLCVTAYIREEEIEVTRIDSTGVKEFASLLADALSKAGETYAPGAACRFCPRQLECEARRKWVVSAGESISKVEVGHLTPDKLAELYPKAKALRDALDRYDEALRAQLYLGPLPLNEAKQLELREYERDVLHPQRAWPVLVESGFTKDDIARTLSMSKSEVNKIVAEKSGTGSVKTRQAELLEKLKAADAVATSTYSRITHCKRGSK